MNISDAAIDNIHCDYIVIVEILDGISALNKQCKPCKQRRIARRRTHWTQEFRRNVLHEQLDASMEYTSMCVCMNMWVSACVLHTMNYIARM